MRKSTTRRKTYQPPALTVNTDAEGELVVEHVTQVSAEPSHFWVKSRFGFPTMLHCPCGERIPLGDNPTVRKWTATHQDCRLSAPTTEETEESV